MKKLILNKQTKYFDEYNMNDKQEIITNTETLVQDQNKAFLEYHFSDISDVLTAVDFTNNAIVNLKTTFFETYHNHYLNSVNHNDIFFKQFYDFSAKFSSILNSHQENILSLFTSLNEEIKKMDDSISEIIKKKNRLVSQHNHFYEQEMKHYVDNQLLFSAESDPTSIDIQALVSDKIRQFETYKKHFENEDKRMLEMISNEYTKLYSVILDKQISHQLVQFPDLLSFLQNYKESLNETKDKVVSSKKSKDSVLNNKFFIQYKKAKDYLKILNRCEKKARNILLPFEREKRFILLENRLEKNKIINHLDQYLHLYQSLINKDTFLAQAIGDYSSKIIKQDLTVLSMLQSNKELKSNINFDIESLNTKFKINEVEMKLIYEVKKQMLVQELDITSILTEIHHFIIDNQVKYSETKINVQKESLLISRMENAINSHLSYLQETANINRQWQSLISGKMISQFRFDEKKHSHISESALKIKLVLNEYNLKISNFRNMLLNEMAFLVKQSAYNNQNSPENTEQILTPFENQMKFSNEQIDLAENEFQHRLESINSTTSEDKRYYEELIQNKSKKYEDEKKHIDDDYQYKINENRHLFSETADNKKQLILNKKLESLKINHQKLLNKYEKNYKNDQLIVSAKSKIIQIDKESLKTITEATVLRDETIKLMRQLYQDASDQHQEFTSYSENLSVARDVDFHQKIQHMNDRYFSKLKFIESTLDEASSTLINQFRKLFSKSKFISSLTNYQKSMKTLVTLRKSVTSSYALKMKSIEEQYLSEIKIYDDELYKLRANQELLKTSVTSKNITTIKAINVELQTLANNYAQDQVLHSKKLIEQTDVLTLEYKEALVSSEKFISSLSLDFDKLIKSYKPYIKLQKTDKKIRRLIKINHKMYKNIQSKSSKSINVNTKSQDFVVKTKIITV
jgi:uncharacterized protein YsxB (DUF464 family)